MIHIQSVCYNILDDVWRVLEVSEFLKEFNNRVYLTVDDALNAVTLETQMKEMPEKQVSIYFMQINSGKG